MATTPSCYLPVPSDTGSPCVVLAGPELSNPLASGFHMSPCQLLTVYQTSLPPDRVKIPFFIYKTSVILLWGLILLRGRYKHIKNSHRVKINVCFLVQNLFSINNVQSNLEGRHDNVKQAEALYQVHEKVRWQSYEVSHFIHFIMDLFQSNRKLLISSFGMTSFN